LSFVDHQGNKQWVWLALAADTRDIVGVYVGARDEAAARKLWGSLRRFSVNVPLLTPIFGQLMPQFFQANDIGQLVKKRVKPALLSDSTTHSDNESLP